MKVWDLEKEFDAFLSFAVGGREKKRQNIRSAVEEVRNRLIANGEKALIDFSMMWDGWSKPYNLKLDREEIATEASRINTKDRSILRGMIRNVRAFHKGQCGKKRTYKSDGLVVREAFVPVERALVYVPGGTAPYPSSLIMGVVPAQLAGVSEIMVTTPAKRGTINPYILAAAELLGIKDIYRIGGAQAIYAFSYGIGNIPKADMIVGPGNAYVEEAKRDVYGRVGIDMLAGPTELIILCTVPFSPKAVAWDLFSQTEHDEMATVGLFSRSKEHLYDTLKAIEKHMASNTRKDIIEKALKQNSYFVFYREVENAVKAINQIAPEHMELIGDEKVEKEIHYPGIIYLGPHTPVAMGDYYIGTNHVLPTGGAGRFTAGLSVDRFMKRKAVVKIDKGFLNRYGDKAIRLSEIEGLFAHGESIKARKELANET
jgi:histidinol dehydrogenase